eukprot:1888585-Prymnesium_polylepis.1
MRSLSEIAGPRLQCEERSGRAFAGANNAVTDAECGRSSAAVRKTRAGSHVAAAQSIMSGAVVRTPVAD